ncbi:MAG: hypothetical protein JRJ15_05435 [Deltaproteobacteria bacterium]|nr:hypothetical protein [Deltaproteobacteria bacterium]
MRNKSGIIWSFIFFIMLAGCSTHQQLAGREMGPKLDTSQIPAPVVSSGVADEPASGSSSIFEDEAGYRIRPIDIKIEGGRPYLPVGAEFTSSEGKVDLGDVIKALANHKGFSVSWADDVDQTRPVDCNIRAADNFYDALNNILRQLDFFYEIEEDTIVVRYKETRTYHLAMPNLSETLDTSLGGNMLPSSEEDTGLEARAKLENNSEEFNFWDGVEATLGSIVQCDGCPAPVIDRTTGTITISASRRVHEDIENHLSLLKKEAYKQVIIEAKVIEVVLSEDHQTGIDWEDVFLRQGVEVGLTKDGSGQIWTKENGWDRFLNSLTLTDATWDVVISAFQMYGDTRIKSNPKVHILNGHGAVLSAGQVVTYLDGCSVTTNTDSSLTTSEPSTASVTEGLSIAVKANIIDDKEVILYVFPAITRIIKLRDISLTDCGMVQAPETAVREMATYAKVRDGGLLVIGGLISEAEEINSKKVPYLGDLPYLGRAFSYETIKKTTTELVILLKPKIIISE